MHAQFLTDDAAVILMHYTGLVQQTERFAAAADADQPTDWADRYMRLAVRFETGAQQYLWLNTNLYIAKGRLLGTGHISTICTAWCDRFTNLKRCDPRLGSSWLTPSVAGRELVIAVNTGWHRGTDEPLLTRRRR